MEKVQKHTQLARVKPHNIEAEQSVLGCNLIDENVPVQVMTMLKPKDFYVEAHKKIFEAMLNIYNENKPIDFVTLTDELERLGTMESVGGIDYITTLTNIVPSAANFKHYVDIVKRDSLTRNLISVGQEIIEEAYDNKENENLLSFAEKRIYDLAQEEDFSSLTHISEPLNNVLEKFERIDKDRESLRGIPTGIKSLDDITNGLQKSDLILLAARPGVGKTSFAMNLVTNAAINHNKKCAVFSLEMPKEQIAQRSLCSIAGVSMSKALSGELQNSDWKALWQGSKKLGQAQIFIDDSSMNTPVEILSKCRRLQREKGGLDLVMIDYLQLMNGSGRESRQLEIGELTRKLKIAAKELQVPIILLSQLSRAVEIRQGDHRPVLSDLRESGSIEQDADIVFFIYNPEKYNDVENELGPNICELIIAKHRNGSIGTINMRWIPEITTFVDPDDGTYKDKFKNMVPKNTNNDKTDEGSEDFVPPSPPPPEEEKEYYNIEDSYTDENMD